MLPHVELWDECVYVHFTHVYVLSAGTLSVSAALCVYACAFLLSVYAYLCFCVWISVNVSLSVSVCVCDRAEGFSLDQV